MVKRKGKPDLLRICGTLAEEMGYELVDAGYEKEPSGLYLRVYLDSEGGIGLEDCERYHRKLQPLVEALDYDFLEVSSPGIDRPIRRPQDALKAVGTQVEVRLFKPQEGSKLFTGVFRGLDGAGYHLETGGRELVFPASAVALARRTIDVDEALKAQDQQDQEDQHEQSES